MNFADLFKPAGQPVPATTTLRRVRRVEDAYLTSWENVSVMVSCTHMRIREESGIQPSAPSAPPTASLRPRLVPLETPWQDGARYREAGACEIATRLDCYVADPAGPWVRRRGNLLAVNPRDRGDAAP
jgi:hypothetical protein